MNAIWRLILLLTIALVLAGCGPRATPQPPAATAIPQGSGAGIANPAAVFCAGQGYKSEIRTAGDGTQSGACVFPDGSECDEWAYFRGECGPAASGSEPAPGTATSGGENKVVEIARGQLAKQLNLDPQAIVLTSLEAVEWPDACLGIANEGEACAAVITPGFRLILSVGDDHYTYHTDLTGSIVRAETAGGKPAQP